MPRLQKKRRVCCLPTHDTFEPCHAANQGRIHLRVDEYEAVRLIDLEQLTQEECAEQMGISRTTVQGIYKNARRKIADALVNGKSLRITGGDYEVCKRTYAHCGGCKLRCGRNPCHQTNQEESKQ